MQPCRTFRLGRISVFDKLDPNDLPAVRDHGAHVCPASMAAAAAAILEYIFARQHSPKDLFLRTPHKTWLHSKKPGKHVATGSPKLAWAFHHKCVKYKLEATRSRGTRGPTRRRYLGLLSTHVAINPSPDTLYFLLLEAVMWLLPKADYSEKVQAYMGAALPRTAYLRYPTLARELQRSFDAYTARARDTKMQVLMQQIDDGMHNPYEPREFCSLTCPS